MNPVQKILMTFFSGCFLHVNGQSLIYPVSIPYLAAAEFAPSVTDAFTCAYNPSTISGLDGFSAGIYTENRFHSRELNMICICAAAKKSQSGFSLLLRYFGNRDYNENCIGINYGFSMGKVTLGAIFNYQSLHITGSPSESYIKYGIASLWQISEKVYTSFRVANPHFFETGNKDHYRVASVTQMGIGYMASKNLYIGFESEKEEGKPPQLIFAICYQYAANFFLKGYWTTGNHQPYLGAGWQWKNIRIETGCGFHQVLGVSPSLTILFQKKNIERQE